MPHDNSSKWTVSLGQSDCLLFIVLFCFVLFEYTLPYIKLILKSKLKLKYKINKYNIFCHLFIGFSLYFNVHFTVFIYFYYIDNIFLTFLSSSFYSW